MKKTNCPNCGAPITDEKCPYCGTKFIDFSCIDTDEPFYLKVKHNNDVFVSYVSVESITLDGVINELPSINMVLQCYPKDEALYLIEKIDLTKG